MKDEGGRMNSDRMGALLSALVINAAESGHIPLNERPIYPLKAAQSVAILPSAFCLPPSAFLPSAFILYKCPQGIKSLFDFALGRGEREADKARFSERSAGDEGDVRFFDQFFAECSVIIAFYAEFRDRAEEIDGGFRGIYGAEKRFEFFDEERASFCDGFFNIGENNIAMLKRCESRYLAYMRSRGNGLTDYRKDVFNKRFRGDDKADAETGHRVIFGQALNRYRAAMARSAVIRPIGKDKIAINLIGDDPRIIFFRPS